MSAFIHRKWLILLIAVGLLTPVLALLGLILVPPGMQAYRESQRRDQVAANLQQIGLALEQYRQAERASSVSAEEVETPLGSNWSLRLPGKFRRRTQEGDIVLWRPGFTIWASVHSRPNDTPASDRLAAIRKGISPDAFALEETRDGDLLTLAYRLQEPSKDHRAAAYYGFAVGAHGHVQLGMYFDDEASAERAKAILRSVKEQPAPNP